MKKLYLNKTELMKKIMLFLKPPISVLLSICLFLGLISSPGIAREKEEDKIIRQVSKLQMNGEYDEAIDILNKEIRLSPSAYKLYYYRGIIELEAGIPEAALKDFDKVIEIVPGYGEAYNKRALAKWDLTSFSGALPDNDKAVELLPENAEAYYNRALTSIRLHNETGALKDLDKAINLDAEYIYAYLSRGELKLMMGYIPEAEQDINSAIDLDDSNPMGYKYKALIMIEKGDTRAAFKYLKKSQSLKYSEFYGNEVNLLLKKLSKKQLNNLPKTR